MKTSAIEINIHPYRASHGQEPRRFGQGGFEILNRPYFFFGL